MCVSMSACVSMSHVSVRMRASARLCMLARTCLSTLTCGKLEIDVRCFSQSYLYLILCLVNFFCFFVCFSEAGLGCPGTHSVPQTVLELTAILPPLHPQFSD